MDVCQHFNERYKEKDVRDSRYCHKNEKEMFKSYRVVSLLESALLYAKLNDIIMISKIGWQSNTNSRSVHYISVHMCTVFTSFTNVGLGVLHVNEPCLDLGLLKIKFSPLFLDPVGGCNTAMPFPNPLSNPEGQS